MKHKVSILATGRFLVGEGVRSIQSTLEELINSAEREIVIAAYTISGGLKEFFNLLEKSAEKGVRITVIINRFSSQPRRVVRYLKKLERDFEHVQIIDFADPSGGDLHMKVIVVDRKIALLGSANLTWKGLVENHEMDILVEGSIVESMCKLLENIENAYKRGLLSCKP